MPIEWTAVLLIFLSSRWIYVLAKRYDKPVISYTAIAVLVYLGGGAILAFLASSIVFMFYGIFGVDYDKLAAGFFTLLGVLSVGIYYFILRRMWKKKARSRFDDEVLDDEV
ncbi:MAG: hypothetical protein NXI10_17385 [bacterium]|nr:hypothetical protein [bacterium]